MSSSPKPYTDVVAVTPVSTSYDKSSEHGTHWYIGRILAKLLAETQLRKTDVNGLVLASYSVKPDTAAVMASYFQTEFDWVLDLPLGGASGVIALLRAARAIQSGDADVVACIGADSMGNRHEFAALLKNFSTFARDHYYPYGAAGPNGIFAMITQHYMDKFGATAEDFGRICITQRESARQNPNALMRKPLTMEQYLAARPIADPLRLYDCVPPCSGGEGFLVMSADRANHLGLKGVKICGALESHNAFFTDPIQYRAGWAKYSSRMYEASGFGPEDMSFLQAYDDYPVMVMIQLEDLGFCGKGDAPNFVRHTSLTPTGNGLPVNTSGGQLSVGQAGAAGGFLGVVEGLRQLTDSPLGTAISPAPQVGVVSGYGYVNYDRGICAAAAVIQRAP